MENLAKCLCCGKAIGDVEYIRYGGYCQICWHKNDRERKMLEKVFYRFKL